MDPIHGRDPTPATRPSDADCAAFNAAFDELGFEWRWEPAQYAALSRIDDERERLCQYLREQQPHLLKAYDLTFLCDAILAVRGRHRAKASAER